MNSDNHIHLILDGKNYKKAVSRHEDRIDDEYIKAVFEGYRQRGVTFLRDGGDNMGLSIRAKALAKDYGIKYISPDFAIHKRGYYGDILGKSFGDMAELDGLLNALEKNGADFCKFMASSIMDFATFGRFEGEMLTPDEVREYILKIKSYGFPVMVHVNSDESIKAAILAGADSIEHGFYMSKETIHLLAESDCVWVPTICAVGNLINNENMRRAHKAVLRRIVEMQISNVSYAMNIACRVALGTDAGSYGVTHEEGIKNEMSFLLEASWDYEKYINEGNGYIKKKFGGN